MNYNILTKLSNKILDDKIFTLSHLRYFTIEFHVNQVTFGYNLINFRDTHTILCICEDTLETRQLFLHNSEKKYSFFNKFLL